MTENIFIFAAYSVITGSITCAIILLIKKIVYKYTSAAFVKMLIGFGLASFVVPSYMIYFLIEGIDSSIICSEYAPDIIVDSEAAMKFYTFIDRVEAGRIVSMIWTIGIILYVAKTLIIYEKTLHDIKKYSAQTVGKTAEIFESMEKSERVILLMSKSTAQPYTIGVRRKYIVFPVILENILSDKEIRLILMHELTHIEKNDAFLKIFIEILNGINWFNPFFYKIKKGYCFWTEADCDETLNQDFDEETRRLYANLLIKVAEINIKYKNVLASFLALKRKNSMTRREELIMKNKKKGTKMATVAMSFMALCVFCGAGYAAKEADYAVYGVFGSDKNIVREGEFDVLTVDEAEELMETRNIDNNSGYSETEPKHIHTWIDVIITEHEKLDNGGCIMIYYNSKVCEDCGKTQTKDIFDVETFSVCPH